MYQFLVVIEKAENNYSAYSPDLPGCVATGKTRAQAEQIARASLANQQTIRQALNIGNHAECFPQFQSQRLVFGECFYRV